MNEGAFSNYNHTQRMSDAQEADARNRRIADGQTTRFTLYTERYDNTINVVARYFQGATLLTGAGLWEGKAEVCHVIEILGTMVDLQKVFDLAGDIKVLNNQSAVLVTWETVSRAEV